MNTPPIRISTNHVETPRVEAPFERTPVRLTKFSKALLALAGVTLAAGGANVLANHDFSTHFSETTHEVVLEPGQSTWDIARTVPGYEKADIAATVQQIEDLNPGLDKGAQIGQSIEVPDFVK